MAARPPKFGECTENMPLRVNFRMAVVERNKIGDEVRYHQSDHDPGRKPNVSHSLFSRFWIPKSKDALRFELGHEGSNTDST
jgi:hypothetical protein